MEKDSNQQNGVVVESGSHEGKANVKPPTETKFRLGFVCITAPAKAALVPDDVQLALGRHHRGDWGDVCSEDWQENELSLRQDFRLLSAYHDRNGTKFWIITEWDRSVTTILLPEDY